MYLIPHTGSAFAETNWGLQSRGEGCKSVAFRLEHVLVQYRLFPGGTFNHSQTWASACQVVAFVLC